MSPRWAHRGPWRGKGLADLAFATVRDRPPFRAVRSLGAQSFGKLGGGNGLECQDGVANARGLGARDAKLGCGEKLFGNATGIECSGAGTVVDCYIGIVPSAISSDEADAARHILRVTGLGVRLDHDPSRKCPHHPIVARLGL